VVRLYASIHGCRLLLVNISVDYIITSLEDRQTEPCGLSCARYWTGCSPLQRCPWCKGVRCRGKSVYFMCL